MSTAYSHHKIIAFPERKVRCAVGLDVQPFVYEPSAFDRWIDRFTPWFCGAFALYLAAHVVYALVTVQR